jgi:hypothetical protein
MSGPTRGASPARGAFRHRDEPRSLGLAIPLVASVDRNWRACVGLGLSAKDVDRRRRLCLLIRVLPYRPVYPKQSRDDRWIFCNESLERIERDERPKPSTLLDRDDLP